MSWESYICSLMADGTLIDAAIVGFTQDQESVWAAYPNGKLSGITAPQIKQLVSKDRSSCFSNGVTLGTVRCTMVRDKFHEEGDHTIDLRTKATESDGETYSICVACSKKALIIVMGSKDQRGGTLNLKAYSMAKFLRDAGY